MSGQKPIVSLVLLIVTDPLVVTLCFASPSCTEELVYVRDRSTAPGVQDLACLGRALDQAVHVGDNLPGHQHQTQPL